MSNAVTALKGARFSGIAGVAEGTLQGMITLRGDLDDKALQKAATAASGTAMPGLRQITGSGEAALAWMSPDELLILCPYDRVEATLAAMHKTLDGQHALAVNVSDARATFTVSGPHAADVLGKLAPVDFAAMEAGEIRRSRMAQVAAAFWKEDGDSFRVICFRSAAQYVFDLLKAAAAEGSAVY